MFAPKLLSLASPRAGLFALLLLLGLLTRVGGLSHPDSVVFDEVHFGKFVTAYCCNHQRIFDVHPPHAKLLIAGTAWLGGYRGGVSFEKIGEPYGAVSPLPLRLLPALAGALLAPLLFVLLLQLGASLPAAVFGGLVVVLDNALVVQSRLINLDVPLLLATFGSLSLWLAAERAAGAGRRWLLWGSGAAAGLAVGCKMTGLAAVGLPAILVGVAVWRERKRLFAALGRYLQFVAVAVLVYLAGWWLHFHLLTEPGQADAWGPWTGSFFTDLFKVHRDIFAFNTGLTTQHTDGSRWWSWPWMGTPIYYWVVDKARIYLLGNPAVWWGVSLLLLVMVVNLPLGRVSALVARGERRHPLWLPLWGFACSYLPFILIGRVMFLYHYLTPLLFSILAVVLWLDEIGWIGGEAGWRQRVSFYGVLVIMVAGFVAISPLTYGTVWGSGVGDWLFARFPGWQ
ncbi:phospholipid carrier-dependent glycosyltransferase [Endothiovibrio diazotrophicus]